MLDGNSRAKYLGFVAHEIKNPLATALWSVDLLRRMEGPDRSGPRSDKIIDASMRALRRMRRLVDDYFTLERLQNGGFELRYEGLQLRLLVDGALAQLGEKEGIPTTRFSADVSEDLSVRGDAEYLRRGLKGVLETLSRASPTAAISLWGGSADGEVFLLVRGEGLQRPLAPAAPEERPSGDPSGAVLGFALCEAVFAVHGGRLEETAEGLYLRFGRPAPAPAAKES
jgi:signal transduction histidine kinase